MSAVVEKTLVTPEELLSLPDQKSFELIDGELRERNVSVLSSWVAGELFGLLREVIKAGHLGWIFGADNGFQCFPDRPQVVRRPDVSFVRADRLSPDQIGEGWARVVPDLVVEVISPNDLAYELDEKVEMYRRAGVPLIWVVNPVLRTVRIDRADGTTTRLREGDQLSGEGVVPGFACPVAAIFPQAPAESGK